MESERVKVWLSEWCWCPPPLSDGIRLNEQHPGDGKVAHIDDHNNHSNKQQNEQLGKQPPATYSVNLYIKKF